MRKNVKILIVTIAALFAASAAQAEVENWYTYWALGIPMGMEYPSELEKDTNVMESSNGADRVKLGLDVLGFYWPLEDGETMMGCVVSGFGDTIEDNSSDTLSVNQYLYAFSVMKFFGEEIGDGFFLRGDVGISQVVVSGETAGVDWDERSDWGLGLVAGIGYGLPVSSESRLLFSLNYSHINVDFPRRSDGYSGAYEGFRLSIGGLW